jgi:hypothetical protein
MAGNGAYRMKIIGTRRTPRPRRGLHRLGRPGLSHCRQLVAVQASLVAGTSTRHAVIPAARTAKKAAEQAASRARSTASMSAEVATLVLVAVVAGTVLVSGWYATAGAAVIAHIVAR